MRRIPQSRPFGLDPIPEYPENLNELPFVSYKGRIKALLKLEEWYSYFEQARLELKHLSHIAVSLELESEIKKANRGSKISFDQLLIQKQQKLLLVRKRTLEYPSPRSRAYYAIRQLKRQKWKMNKRKRRRVRSPAQARAIGVSYTVSESDFRGYDHNIIRYNLKRILGPRRSKKKARKSRN